VGQLAGGVNTESVVFRLVTGRLVLLAVLALCVADNVLELCVAVTGRAVSVAGFVTASAYVIVLCSG